ncbi:MAG: hypothetical protein JSW13_01540 [Candidatus Aerophobus sp.]|nr:MAG: hypothetical protein JSW13_01540 [Candidatus Aerophobus sp.]
MVDRIRKTAENLCKIPGENIQVVAFHTHSGPETGVIFAEVNQEYLDGLPRLIAQGICKAKENLKKMDLWVGRGEEYTLCNNRRIWMKDGTLRMNWEKLNPRDIKEPAGPVDPEVGIIIAKDGERRTPAILINYSCHPAILAGDNFSISEDYAGYTTRFIESKTGALSIFTNGATGNINHINVYHPEQRRGFYEAERLGTILGRKVTSLIDEASPLSFDKINLHQKRIELPLRFVSPQEVKWAKSLVEGKEIKKISLVDGIPDQIYAQQILTLSKIKEKILTTEVDVLSLGDKLALVSIPGELFVELGLKIKKQSPFPYTYIVGYANDYVGYIPTKKAFEEGGYEVRTGAASKLAPEAGEIILKQILSLLKEAYAGE